MVRIVRSLVLAMCAIALLAVPAGASAQTVSFASPSFLSTGGESSGVAIADFNGDGILDLAVINPAGSVTVYLGNGDGGFTADGPFPVTGDPQSIAVADFNGDGLPDIVTADDNGTTVSVLMNTTTKGASAVTFASHQDFTVGTDPGAIAVGDFNGDGLPDIATANYGSGNVSVLLNTTAKDSSTASFATHADFSVQSNPLAIAVGDLNGDGRPDIATSSLSGSLSVLLNTTATDASAATFDAQQTITPLNGAPTRLAIGDLDGTDEPDLVVGYDNEFEVGVLADTTPVGSDTVTVATEQDFPVGDPTSVGVVVADMNGDGRPDIVYASNAGKISVLVNTTPAGASSLSFDSHQDLASTFDTLNSLAVGDVNGDGRPDIVATIASGTTDNVVMLLSETTALATSAPASGTVGSPMGDSATLTAGKESGGTITFAAYGPDDATCAGPAAFTSSAVEVAGSGSYASPSFTPTETGVYRWIATYSGDATDAATATACDEPVTVTLPAVPGNIVAPAITGKTNDGSTLTCGPGSWSGSPTAYKYQWTRDGTPIIGATGATYRVGTADEGSTLSCTVTASNAGGAGAAVTSKPVKIPIPFVLHCPPATGKLSGTTLGRLRLGMTRAQTHKAYPKSSSRHQRYLDFFCLKPIGVRAGYASPKLLHKLPASEQHALAGRVVWISTSNPVYDVKGIRAGATLTSARTHLPHGNLLRVGKNDWYLAPAGASTAVLKVRHGVVQEIGIGNKALTRTRSAQFAFMTSFD
jgi:hypothetical protein